MVKVYIKYVRACSGRMRREKNREMALWLMSIALFLGSVNSDNSTASDEDDCDAAGVGPWSLALEDWAASASSDRHGRIMVLPPTRGFYVTERIDTPYLSPPPPPPALLSSAITQVTLNHTLVNPHLNPVPPSKGHITKIDKMGLIPTVPEQTIQKDEKLQVNPENQGRISQHQGYGYMQPPPVHQPQGHGAPGASKIVNRPPAPYKDKDKYSYYKPNYQQNQMPPSYNQRPSIDRVDPDPPKKQVTETDLYLLGAIEKLVYRVDLMEKRLRKMEESVHYLVAGVDTKPDPCPSNYTRVGSSCYEWSPGASDWKGASVACRKQRAALLEFSDEDQKRAVFSKLLSDKKLRGSDFWTGGLNPGLLWIWSHSAKPVEGSGNSTSIIGEGRCLALVHDASRNTYVYRGQDCALQHRYICQKEDSKEKLSNEIERVARMLRPDQRKSKLLWDLDRL